MRLGLACARDAVDLRDYLRRAGFISFLDEDDDAVVHVAGSTEPYTEMLVLVTRALGEWERQQERSVEILDYR